MDKIKQYIPQREPVIMVDSLNEETSITGLTVKDDNIFVKNGFFREPGLIEHIAQSAAAVTGFNFVQQNKNIPLGFIASIRDLEINKLPVTGDKLVTEINIVNQVLNVVIIKGHTKVNEQLIATCEMRIFINE